MKATHINYLHPRHLRVIEDGKALCMAPSCSTYSKLAGRGLPDFSSLPGDEQLRLLAERRA